MRISNKAMTEAARLGRGLAGRQDNKAHPVLSFCPEMQGLLLKLQRQECRVVFESQSDEGPDVPPFLQGPK